MLGATERLALLITANGTQAVSEFSKVGAAAETNLRAADTSSQRLSAGLTRAGAGFVTLGALALVGLGKAAQAADEEQLATEKLNTAFANSPLLAGQSTDALVAQAQALQRTTVYADDATIGMQALLATYRLTSEEIQGLTPLVQDLASFWGMDLESAAKAVGKAMQGNIGALQRQGIAIDEAAFATNRYDAVVDALRENAGGFAEQEGDSFAGQLEILKNTAGDLAEGIGAGAIPVFVSFAEAGQKVFGWLSRLDAVSGGLVGTLGAWGGASAIALGGLLLLGGQIAKLKTGIEALRASSLVTSMGGLGPAAAVVAGGVGLAYGAVRLFSDGENEAVGDVDALSAALRRQNDAVGESTEAWLSTTILDGDASQGMDDLTTAMDAAGLTIADLNAALGEGGDAFDDFEERLQGADVDFQLIDAFDALDSLQASFDDAAAANRLADGLGATQDAADGTAESADEAADAVRQLTSEIDDWVESVQGIEASRDSVQESFQSLYESLLQNGSAWQGDTEKARENRGAMRDLVSETAAYISTLVEQGASEQRIQRVKAATIRRLMQARDAGLLSASAFEVLTRRINNVPGSTDVRVTSNVVEVLTRFEQLPAAIQAAAAAADHAQASAYAPGNNPRGNNPGGAETDAAPRPRMRQTARRNGSRRPVPVISMGNM